MSESPLVINEETRKRPAEEESESSEPGWVVALKSRIDDKADDGTEWTPPKHRTRKKRVTAIAFPPGTSIKNRYDVLSSGDDLDQ